MNFIVHFFWNHFITVMEEKRFVNGKEEVCLIIPTETNQIKKGRNGNWLSIFRLAECPPNEKMITHDMQLMYLNEKEVQKSYDMDYHRRTAHIGRVRVHDRTPEKRIDRTNTAQDIECHGVVVLSDIPKSLIFRNGENDKRYIQNLVFRNSSDDTFIYTGSICVDDIPRDDIKTENYTGKKYVDATFRRLKTLDTYMNTHQLVIVRDDGSAIEIGRFKEFRKEGAANVPPKEEHTTTVSMRPPTEINGIRF